MKAMIFAAGLGTRLKPFTDSMPKALVPVAGIPLLERLIIRLKAAGFDEIIINVHHFAEQIVDFLRQNNSFDIRIEISDERETLLDTGGGIRQAQYFFDDGKPFLVHNVDIISDVDLQQVYQNHILSQNDASLLVSRRQTSRYLLFDDRNRLCGWTNTTTGEVKSPYPSLNTDAQKQRAFSGIHVLSPDIFKHMEGWADRFSIIDFYLQQAATLQIGACEMPHSYLIDAGKPDSLLQAEEILN